MRRAVEKTRNTLHIDRFKESAIYLPIDSGEQGHHPESASEQIMGSVVLPAENFDCLFAGWSLM